MFLVKLNNGSFVEHLLIVNIILDGGYLYSVFWDSSWGEFGNKGNNWAMYFDYHQKIVIGEVGRWKLRGLFIDSQYLIGFFKPIVFHKMSTNQ